MKHIAIILFMLYLKLYATAQDTCVHFEWANTPVSSNENWGYNIWSDAAGNTYSAGEFSSLITFGNHTLSSLGKQDIYVVKTNSSGQYLWATHAGGNNDSCVIWNYGVASDSNDNSYIKGYFQGRIVFGNTILTNHSNELSMYIAKLNPNGQFLWAIQTDSISASFRYHFTADIQGNCYIYGKLQGIVNFDSTTLTPTNQKCVFIAKINTQGEYEWAVNILGDGSYSTIYPSGISIDKSGNILITGTFFGDTLFIGNQEVAPSSTGKHLYIAKLNPQGQVEWVNYAQKTTSSLNINNCFDNFGNSYFISDFDDSIKLGNITLEKHNNTNSSIYVAKVDTNGEFVTAVMASVNSLLPNVINDIGIITDNNGNCYIAGGYKGTITLGNTIFNSHDYYTSSFVAKIEKQNFNFAWAINSKGSNHIIWRNIAVDSLGNCYITGRYIDTLQLDNIQLVNTKHSMFITKISTECPTDINILTKSTEPIKVYPNPVQGNGFSLILSEQYQYHLLEVNIYDITGRKLYNHKGKIEEINQYLSSITTNTAKGLWTVQVISHTSGKSESMKVSVQ